jgi:hypothetical protein
VLATQQKFEVSGALPGIVLDEERVEHRCSGRIVNSLRTVVQSEYFPDSVSSAVAARFGRIKPSALSLTSSVVRSG